MKTIPHTLVFSLIPFLHPLTAIGAPDARPEHASAAAAKVNEVPAGSWRASKVIGTNVKNASDESIGDVEDLVVDMKSGRIQSVIISSGGFLGMADTLSSVPVSALRYDTDAKAFKTPLTKEQLQSAPSFNKSAWPDYNNAATTDKLQASNDSIGPDSGAPDNTARNKEERKVDATDPTDQGGSGDDLETTRKIRSEIVDAELSFNTKNIKIITAGGHVTLKGVVKNHAEHQAVLKIAGKHTEKSKISDQLKMEQQ